ncbi:MAG: alpha/beta hydrolase [Gemmatimonadota bacterium]|nr:alpha/beta hydrolase [Gemmatimonadota bacterium]
MVSRDSRRIDGQLVPFEVHHGPARPLWFLPGFGVHPSYYAAGLHRLAHHFTVYVPDLSFRSHPSLPQRIVRYRMLLEELADHVAPDAPRAGHSFGGLMAMLGSRPALALSPMVPVPCGWPAKVWRAVRLQVREYAGLEGRLGARWAAAILRDYVGTAIRRPASLFPAIAETLGGVLDSLLPTAPTTLVVLAERDHLYRRREVEAYLSRANRTALTVRQVATGHDWPVTHPELLESEVCRALAFSAAGALSTR